VLPFPFPRPLSVRRARTPMGPITLFDKSFLQFLSVDESVFFDRFFFPVICPCST